MKHFFFFLFTFHISQFTFSQTPIIDSLIYILKTAKEDTFRVNILNDICWEYQNIGEFDTALHYCNEAIAIIQNHSETISTFSKTDDKFGLVLRRGEGITYNNLGVVYWNKANYLKALENYFSALKIEEELDNKIRIAKNLGNIGLVYWNQGDDMKALKYYFKALEIGEKVGNKSGIAPNLSNIGIIYLELKNYPKSLEYYFKALEINKEIGNKNGVANNLGNIGVAYDEQATSSSFPLSKVKELQSKALEYYLEALKIDMEIGNKNRIAIWFGNIGSLYAKQKKYSEAEEYLFKSLKLSKEIGDLYGVMEVNKIFGELFYKKTEYKKAYEHHQQYFIAKDSIFNEESSKQITEMSTKYDTEKKEQQIKILNKDKEIHTKDLQRQKTIRNAVAGFLLLVTGFLFVLINRFVLIRRQKKIIETERTKSEKLLLNILPKSTADELKLHNKVVPKSYEMVTVMFTDFKGFTSIAEKMSAEDLVNELDFIFKKFDEIISKYLIEKIKTIGDSYMCAGGLPVANTTNPIDVVMAGMEIQEWMKAQNKWQLRIGIHTGQIIAGVVGDKKFAYDIWGDTVNMASRMESSGEEGKVNISGETYKMLVKTDNFPSLHFTYRGKIPTKNKGEVEMYFVE